jgi:hypothetical protein
MDWYVSAHRQDGSEILGNLDMQGRINAKQYKRTDHYKNLLKKVGPDENNTGRPYYYQIHTGYDGPVVETIYAPIINRIQ